MSTPNLDGLKLELDAGKMKEGNAVVDELQALQTGTDLNAFMFVDGNSTMQVGPLPFAAPLAAGVTSTSNSVLAIEGSATGSANELMHLTLVAGANATATIAGYYRVSLVDDAGVITSGAYYAPFYTLN